MEVIVWAESPCLGGCGSRAGFWLCLPTVQPQPPLPTSTGRSFSVAAGKIAHWFLMSFIRLLLRLLVATALLDQP